MSNGKKRAKRFIDTLETINEKDMVRDAKTGKEMSYRQYRKLEDKQDIDEDKKEFPRLAKKGFFGEPPKKNRFGKQVQQREDQSVFDYQTKGKPIKKIVGKIKRAMGMSGLKDGGKPKPYGMKHGGKPYGMKREDAMDNIKKVAKKMASGGSGNTPKRRNKVAAALRLDDRYRPRIVRDKTKYNRKSKWSKHYGMKTGGSPKKPYGMKHGGSGKSVCRGMGAATRGGNYNR